jgi:PAS domain S-box-containing protein
MISVLYVDDEPGLLEIARIFLEASGEFTVATSTSAKKSLELLRTQSYDAIISDYQMPEIDGITFLKTVRERYGDTPFILFTGRGREEIVIEAINNGADFYIQKGGDPRAQFAELAHKVRQAVRRREAEQELRRSEEKYRLVVENGYNAVYIYRESQILFTNSRATDLTGYTHDELMGMNIWDLVHPDDRIRMQESGKRRISGITLPPNFTGRIIVKSGDVRDCEFFVSRILYQNQPALLGIIRDITEQKREEDIVRESEKKYHDLAELLPQVVFEVDTNGKLKYTNHIAFEYFGYTEDDFRQGLFVMQMLAPEDVERATAAFRSIVEGKGMMMGVSNEYTALRKDKSTFPISIYPSPIVVNGRITGLRGIIINITEHKRVEEALRESEERFRGMAERSSDLVFIMGKSMSPTYVSPSAQKILGYDPEELLGKTPEFAMATIFSQSGPGLMKAVQATMTGHTVDEVEIQLTRKDGTLVYVSVHAVPVRHGEVLDGAQVSMRDITERKRAEAELQKNQYLLSEALDMAHMADWELDASTGVFTFNDRFYALYGTTAEREGGYQMPADVYAREFTRPDDQYMIGEEIEKALSTPDSGYFSIREHRIIRRDGEVRWITVRIRVTKDAEGRTIKTHGANQDVTDRKRAEEALRQANNQLNLLSGITRHDINNQLLTLNGFVALLQRDISSPSSKKYFSRITEASSNITQMIAFTKEYEKIGAGAPVWQDLTTVIATAGKGIILGQVSLADNLPAGTEVIADPMLEKVFFNLLDNAIRHGERVTEIRVSSHPSGEDLVVVWEDNGIGIAADEKERIFERGFGKNTGLGMFLVREILSLTGITITETGEPGVGARFEITVPHGSWRAEEKPADKK